MQLSDLPTELLVRVLPIEDCLLDLPNEIIIPWLNLLPQVELFRILGDSGCGCKLTNKHDIAHTTLSGKICTKYGDCFETADACFKKVFDKFNHRIFIKTGQSIEAKYYKKYVIFDFETVRHLVCEYYKLLCCLQLWTGCDRQFIVLWSYYFVWDLSDGGKKVSVLHPSRFHVSNELIKFSNSWFNDNELLSHWIIATYQRGFLSLKNLELVMSVDEFIEMRNNVSYMGSFLQPREVRIYLSLVQNSVGEAVSTECPTDFPIEWVTDLFVVKKVQIFTLHYFDSNTTFDGLGALILKMPRLLELDLSFGKLDFEKIAKLLPFKNNDCHIQVKVDKSFFEAYLFKCIYSIWRIDVQDTYVEVGYVKRALSCGSTVEPLTLARCVSLWLEYRRWKRRQRKSSSAKYVRVCKNIEK